MILDLFYSRRWGDQSVKFFTFFFLKLPFNESDLLIFLSFTMVLTLPAQLAWPGAEFHNIGKFRYIDPGGIIRNFKTLENSPSRSNGSGWIQIRSEVPMTHHQLWIIM